MLKRILSGFTAIAIIMSVGSVAVSANEIVDPNTGDMTADEIIADILSDEEFLNSDNIMAQELLDEIESEEQPSNGMESGNINMGGTADPQWGASGTTESDHANIVDAAMAAFDPDMSPTKRATVYRCLVYGSYKADTKAMHDSDNGNNIVQLHAIGNYVANLNVVWKYTKLIYGHDQQYCYDHIVDCMSLPSDEKEDVKILLNTIPLIFDFYEAKYNVTPSKLEQKYLVMGLGLHLIGDIYAHRTVVPLWYGDPSVADNYFEPQHFTDYEAFLKVVHKGGLLCTRIKRYMRKDLPGGINKYYEDNINFIPNRYEYSKKTSINFIKQIRTSGNYFKSEYILRSSSDDVTLYGFGSYALKAGL